MKVERKNCLECGSPLGRGAIKCRCGWKAEPEPEYVRSVACCYAGCPNNATMRVWTRTGWANVCPVDYEHIEIVPRVSESPIVKKIREAHLKRKASQAPVEHKEAA